MPRPKRVGQGLDSADNNESREGSHGRGDAAVSRGEGGRGRGDATVSRGEGSRGRGNAAVSRGERGRGRGDAAASRGGGSRGRGDAAVFRGGGQGGAIVFSGSNERAPSPSAEVSEVENTYLTKLLPDALPDIDALRLNSELPLRPAYGLNGKEVVLWTNYFALLPEPDLVLYRYNVRVDPTAAGKKLGQIIKLLIDSPNYADMRGDIVTDFKSTLISRHRLNTAATETSIQYRLEGEDKAQANAMNYRISIEETGSFTVSDLTNHLTSSNLNQAYTEKLPIIQAMNILLGHYAKSSPAITTIGSSKSFFGGEGSAKADLGVGLTALRGFFSSVRVATCRILVNVNVSHGAFYDSIPLDELILKYCQSHQFNLAKLASFLKGVRVKTTHLPERKNQAGDVIIRAKSIFGLATPNDGHQKSEHRPRVPNFGARPGEVEFFLSDSADAPSSASTAQAAGNAGGKKKDDVSQGRYISVCDFFQSVHKRSIANRNLPLVNVGNKDHPSYLPAEVCVVLPGQSSNTKLDPTQTKRMIDFAIRKPADNAKSITQDSPGTVGLSPQTNITLARFGVSMTPNLITVPGRVLATPSLQYLSNKPASDKVSINNGGWNLQGLKITPGSALQAWRCVMISKTGFTDAFTATSLPNTMKEFADILTKIGIVASAPASPSRILVNTPQEESKIRTMFENAPGDPWQKRLLVFILPMADVRLYNRIKRLGDLEYGVHTICVVGSKFSLGQAQYFANVALKLNLKLGGINQTMDLSRFRMFKEDSVMVVGIDVTHPSPGSASNAPSVAGMVASIDCKLAQWPADLRIQEARKEMVSDLSSMLKSRLQLWRTQGKHRTLPNNLLIYRDGVSEGQYASVLDKELPLLRQACTELYPPADTKKGMPRITIIIVGKRHHTRFYPTAANEADRSSNPKCGTVVDRGVTEARNWDFFMQAHTAIQGTARPAHYFIILDEIFRKQSQGATFKNAADAVEDLTHSMCYLFGRATKAVSICPPAYYADLVCERARCYLSGLFDLSTLSETSIEIEACEAESLDPTDGIAIDTKLRNTMFYI